MQTSDSASHIKGFDNERYIQLEKVTILDRVDKFRNGKLYLEIGGKFLSDPHASRVLPGYNLENKLNIFRNLESMFEIIFCLNMKAWKFNRQMENANHDAVDYKEACLQTLLEIEKALKIRPLLTLNMVNKTHDQKEAKQIKKELETLGYKVYLRYETPNYPDDSDFVLSANGYGQDDYVETSKKLIIVIGPSANSGKLSTCLGQIYQDHVRGMDSGYAKLETFPIWNLPLDHPVNLAYEAATADIGDINMVDPYHEKAYGKKAINYNRDVEAFDIIKGLTEKFISPDNYIGTYKSPTDMGVNYAGHAIVDDRAVCLASLEEIRRRSQWYLDQANRGKAELSWSKKCNQLEIQALKYMRERGYVDEPMPSTGQSQGLSLQMA